MKKYIVSIIAAAAICVAGVTSADLIITSPKEAIQIEANGDVKADAQRVLPTVNKKTEINAKVTVRGWDAQKKEQIEAKIQAALEHNPNISSLEVSENSVLVKYGATARVLGIVPVTMPMTITADADAKVKVQFPWWKFMVTSYFSNTAQLMNGVFQNNQTDLEFLLKKPTEERQVEIFIKISDSLRAMEEMSK